MPARASAFALEPMEPRILLSGDTMAAGMLLDPVESVGDVSQVLETTAPPTVDTFTEAEPYDPAAQLENLFDGLDAAPAEPEATPQTLGTAPDGGDPGMAASVTADLVPSVAGQATTESGSSCEVNGAVGYANSMTQELTDTLHAANGPPSQDVDLEMVLAMDLLPSPLDEPAQSLNAVINALLGTLDTAHNYSGEMLVFTESDPLVPSILTVGHTASGEVNLRLQNVTLTFSDLSYDSQNLQWNGQVVIEAELGVLLPGVLDLDIVDDPEADSDAFAVVGIVYLNSGNTSSFLAFDPLDAEALGWPAWLDIQVDNLQMDFPNFRADDSQGTLTLDASFLGFDTGIGWLNTLLRTGPLSLSLTGNVEDVVFDLGLVRQGKFPITQIGGIAAEVKGSIFKVGRIEAGFILQMVEIDAEGLPTTDPAQVTDRILFGAVEGTLFVSRSAQKDPATGNTVDNGGDVGLGIHLAISELGPLQFFVELETGAITIEPISGLALSGLRGGISFNSTVNSRLVGETEVTDGQCMDVSGTGSGPWEVTFTVSSHTFDVGDEVIVRNSNSTAYDGTYRITRVTNTTISYLINEADPGPWLGGSVLVKAGITDPLDLRDPGLRPTSKLTLFEWRQQLENQVALQLKAAQERGDQPSWSFLVQTAVIEAGASFSFEPRIPNFVINADVDLLFDTEFRILLTGRLNVLSFLSVPVKLYGDFSRVTQGAGVFLFLGDLPEVPANDAGLLPLLVLRGAVSFETLIGGSPVGIDFVTGLPQGVHAIPITEGVRTDTSGTQNGPWEVTITIGPHTFQPGDDVMVWGAERVTYNGTHRLVGVDDTTITFQIASGDPGEWAGGGVVVDTDELGGSLQINLEGGIDFNIPFVTTVTLEGSAELTFTIPGPASSEEARIDLFFDAHLSEAHLGDLVKADGAFHATIDLDNGVELPDAQGNPTGIVVPSVAVWGGAILSLDFSCLESIGLFADGGAFLRINTTGTSKQETLRLADGSTRDLDLPPLSYSVLEEGTIEFRLDGNNDQQFAPDERWFFLDGLFAFELGAGGLTVAVAGRTTGRAVLAIGPPDQTFLEFEVLGFLAVRSTGVAAQLEVTLTTNFPSSIGVEIDGGFQFVLNTTAQDITFTLPSGVDPQSPPLTLTLPGAPPPEGTPVGEAWTVPAGTPGQPYLLIRAGGTGADNPHARLIISDYFVLQGRFDLLVTPSVLEVEADAQLDLKAGDTPLLSFQAVGGLRIDSSGLLAAIHLSLRVDIPAQYGFRITSATSDAQPANFQFEANTTGVARTIAGIPVAPGVLIHADGKLVLAGFLTLSGIFDLRLTSTEVTLQLNATMRVFSFPFAVAGFASIRGGADPGLVLDVMLRIGDGTSGTISPMVGVFNITGTFNLQINTTHHEVHGVQSGARIRVAGVQPGTPAEVNLFGFKMTGSITIGITNGAFTIHIPSGPEALTLNFFGFATLRVYGDLNANGSFSFTATASANINLAGIFSFSGQLSVTFTSEPRFTGQLSGTVSVLGVSASVTSYLSLSASTVTVSFSVKVVLIPGFWVWVPFKGWIWVKPVTATVTAGPYTLGAIDPPGQVTPPPPTPQPILATLINLDGQENVLALNIGSRASFRDPNNQIPYDNDPEESFTVRGVTGDAGNETVTVEAYGETQQYSGVSKIVVLDAGAGADYVEIGPNVRSHVDVNGGEDDDTLRYSGSGTATLRGGPGNDNLTALGGTATLNGGPGDDILFAQAGLIAALGGDGDDTIEWNLAGGGRLTSVDGGENTGGDLKDILVINGTGAPETLSVSPAATLAGFELACAGASTTATGLETLKFNAEGGNDSISVNDLDGAGLSEILLMLGEDQDDDTVTVHGTAAADTYGLSTTGFPDLEATVLAKGNWHLAVAQALHDTLAVQAGDGADVFDVQATLGGLRTILNGGAAADAFHFGSQMPAPGGTLNGIAGTVVVEGEDGSDTLTVDDSGDSGENQGWLTDTTITGLGLGTDTIHYLSIATLTISLGSGNDTFAVAGTNATTETTINANAGINAITVGNATPTVNQVLGALIVNGHGGTDLLTINDSGDGSPNTGMLSASAITGLGLGAPGIQYHLIENLMVKLGTGNDKFTVAGTNAATQTTINANIGQDTIAVENATSTLNDIFGALLINGQDGQDLLIINDSGDPAPNIGALTSSAITGLGLGLSGIQYHLIESLTVRLGTGDDHVTVPSLNPATDTMIHTGAGSDIVDVFSWNATLTPGGTHAINEGYPWPLVLATSSTMNPLQTLAAAIDWGDGTAVGPGVVSETNGLALITGHHAYGDNGIYLVMATVQDNQGLTVCDTLVVTVNNVAPTLSGLGMAPTAENAVGTLTVTITDPGTLDTFTLDVDWGDPLSPYNLEQYVFGASATGSQTFTLTHRYLDDNPTGTPADPYTISATVTDDDTGAGSDTATVSIQNVGPSLVLNPVAAIDEHGVATLTGTITDPGTLDTFTLDVDWDDPLSPCNVEQYIFGASATGSQTFTLTHRYLDDNPTGTPSDLYTISARVTDDDAGVGTRSQVVTVNNTAPTVTAVTGAQSRQYSDPIQEVVFAVTDPSPRDTMNAETSYRRNGGDFIAGLPDALTISAGLSFSGAVDQKTPATWTLSGIADLAPGTYVIRVTVTDDDGGTGIADTTITVVPEDARSTYVGPLFVSTLSINESTAIVELRAVIQDITFYPEAADWDPNAGHIAASTVTFINVDTGQPIAAGLEVLLIDPSDPTTGVAVYEWVVDLGTADSKSLTVGCKVGGFYSSPEDTTVITVSKPLENFITGGGYLINENSAGTYAGDDGLRTNFGFNVKFNRSLTNLQGKVNAIVRQGGRVYQIRTNATESLVVDPMADTATFVSKANLVDITDPNCPISIEGNLKLIVTLTDWGEPGTSDSISFTLWKNNKLLFSSNWTGARTLEQVLAGGNVVVHADPLALQAAQGRADAQTNALPLTLDSLAPIVAEAIERWAGLGDAAKIRAALEQVDFQIADLPGSTLGCTLGTTVWIDQNAAGHGWFVDNTPSDDAEFSHAQSRGGLAAKPTSEAGGGIDLLTAVAHELGHVMGLDHTPQLGLMNQSLAEGVRYLLPTPNALPLEPDPSSWLWWDARRGLASSHPGKMMSLHLSAGEIARFFKTGRLC